MALKMVRRSTEDWTRPCPCCESVDTLSFPRKVYGKGLNQTIDANCSCRTCGTEWRSYDFYNYNQFAWFEKISEVDQKC